MPKAELKTKKTKARVKEYFQEIKDVERRKDSEEISRMMQEVTGEKPAMWGTSIVGFGEVPLKYASGRELDWPIMAFSCRKTAITLYLTFNLDAYASLLSDLGPHKRSKGCLYIKRLSGIKIPVLKKLLKASLKEAKAKI